MTFVPTAAGTIAVNDLKRHNAPLLHELRSRMDAVLDRGWYILGPVVAEFEGEFARYCGADHSVGVANGTDALELALRACGVGPGSNVITVANAGGYGTTAIRLTGADPIFVDIDPQTLLIDPAALRRSIAPGVKAILVTHLYGRMADMPAILEIAGDIPVIEDCAQAHGARLNGTHAGTFGMVGCFSFYPTKNLGALGDGGALITSSPELAERLRQLRQYGWTKRYTSGIVGGRNSRLDELQAAVLLAKLPHLDAWNQRRLEIARSYTEAFRGLPVGAPATPDTSYVAHLYVIRTTEREPLQQRLRAAGVGTDIHYPTPDHRQECYRHEAWARVSLPETERACGEVLTLPCFPEMTSDEVSAVATAVRNLLPAGR